MRSGKLRLGANAWILLVILLVFVVVGVEVGRTALKEAARDQPAAPASAASPGAPAFDPDFRVGDPAPEFTLPDRAGRPHKLSELVRGDTLLCFICGCASCEDLQTYMGLLARKMGKKAPQVVSVSTMPKESEESWVRRTGLPQTLVYEPKDGPVMDQYRGHPCPRVYRVDGARKVTWISPSPKDVPSMRTIGLSVAMGLGFAAEEARRVGEGFSTSGKTAVQ